MYFIEEHGDLLRKVQEKNWKLKSKKFLRQKIVEWSCNQNVSNADLKSQDLLNNEKQKDYWVI